MQSTSGGYGFLGTAVVGTTLTLNVPFNWKFQDSETANQQRFRSRSGISWAYNVGPASRQLSLTMVGDVSQQQRRTIRDQVKSISKYGKFPLAFVAEPSSTDPSQTILCQYEEQTSFSNDGWYYDSVLSQWRPIGDMSVTLTELV